MAYTLTTGQGYGGADQTRARYSLMERDAAGLDHAWWRKYESESGRWTTPDPYVGSMSVGNPQSLNRYAYVKNDPVNRIDPSGLSDVGTIPSCPIEGGPCEGPRLGTHNVNLSLDFLEYVNGIGRDLLERPQGKIRNVDSILKKIRWLGDNVNKPDLKSKLLVHIMQLLSKGCADAFRRAGLSTPEEIINKSLTIASSPLLNDSSNNDILGISESVRREAVTSEAPAQTIGPQFTTKGPIIFFRAEAFTDIAYLDEAVAHEFIHASGVGKVPLWGYSLGRGNDLSGYAHYTDIIDNCGFQNVIR